MRVPSSNSGQNRGTGEKKHMEEYGFFYVH